MFFGLWTCVGLHAVLVRIFGEECVASWCGQAEHSRRSRISDKEAAIRRRYAEAARRRMQAEDERILRAGSTGADGGVPVVDAVAVGQVVPHGVPVGPPV